eukprot:Rhum_TRINITY_DN15165_c14_g1::Rhum_TRINITY_DN15165_c14_g1_i1::g.141700::m.141700
MRGLGYLASGLAAGPPKKDASRDASPFVAAAAQPASPSSPASGGAGSCAASAGHARAVGRLLDAVGRRVAVADAAGLELLRENGAVSAALRGGCAGVYALEDDSSAAAVADNVRTLRMLGELADDGEDVAAALAFVVSSTKRDAVLECRDFAVDVCRRAGSGIGGGWSPEGCPVLVVVGVGDAACGTGCGVQGFEVVHAPLPCTVLPHMFHLNVEGAVPFDSRPFAQQSYNFTDIATHCHVPFGRLESYCDAASRLAATCGDVLDCDVDCVWCVGDASRVVGRLVANEAAEQQTRRRRRQSGDERRRQKAGVVLVDRTLDVLPALPRGADAVLHAVAARSAADGELPRLSGVSCDDLRALLADPQALKGRAIATLAPLAARDARVQELLRRGISSTERLFALCKSVAVSEAGGLHAAEPAADDGDRRVLALVCHLAGLDVSALQDRAAADGADDAAAASSLEGRLRGLLKAMKEGLRSVSSSGGASAAAAENPALDASVDAIAGLLVAFATATHGDGGGGGDAEAGEGGGGGGAGWAEVSEEESILLEEYSRVLQRLLLAAVAAAASDAAVLWRRLGGALVQVLLQGADGEAAAAEEAASRVLRGARRVCGARRAAGVLSEDLLGSGGGGSGGSGGFLAGLAAHA